MVKLWHSLLPQAIVVYLHWKTMEIQALKAKVSNRETRSTDPPGTDVGKGLSCGIKYE